MSNAVLARKLPYKIPFAAECIQTRTIGRMFWDYGNETPGTSND